MADRHYDLEDLINRPGTYFNPHTEVLVVVDDSSSLDNAIFNKQEFEGADWVLISDALPIEEAERDELLERFQARHHDGDGPQVSEEDVDDEPEPELVPDASPEDLDADEDPA